MRQSFYAAVSLLLFSCHSGHEVKDLRVANEQLKAALAKAYKPGFGEFMSGIQQHHAKLWFAGKEENWELADFEIKEIQEALESLHQYQPERKETEGLSILNPVLDTLSALVLRKDQRHFEFSFSDLTSTCNQCHQKYGFGFNRVIIPVTMPVVNQDFRPLEETVHGDQ